MRPFAVIREALDAAQLRGLAQRSRTSAETPPRFENGCVCEQSDDPQGAWRIDRAAYVAARRRPPVEGALRSVARIAETHLFITCSALQRALRKPPCTSVEFRWHADAALQIPGWNPVARVSWVSIRVTNVIYLVVRF